MWNRLGARVVFLSLLGATACRGGDDLLLGAIAGITGRRRVWHPAPGAESAPAGPCGGRRPVPRSHRAAARGGVIHRDDLDAILNEGIGRFLQQVSVTAALERGRFVGWRLLELRPRADRDWTDALMPGDIVVRMNGHSLERPGDFKRAWDSMRDARSLQFDIRRELVSAGAWKGAARTTGQDYVEGLRRGGRPSAALARRGKK
jgi:hypothetical protein